MANGGLRTIMPIAGWPEERAREVEISVGADAAPSQFYENFVCGAVRNYTGYYNPEVDALRLGGPMSTISTPIRNCGNDLYAA